MEQRGFCLENCVINRRSYKTLNSFLEMWVGGFTVDGRNLAPVDTADIQVFTVFYISQLVQGFFPSTVVYVEYLILNSIYQNHTIQSPSSSETTTW